MLEYGSISRFKGVFRGFPLLDVGLYCFDALRGLWGFCVREWLGGLEACGVFASVFLLLLLCLPAFMLVVLLCSGCLSLSSCIVFVALWVWLLFPFPLRYIRKKERAQRFCPLCPLFVCCGRLNSCVVIKEFRCRCFGFFQFVRFVLPCNAAGVRRLARSYFDFFRHYVDITNNRSAFLK